MDVQTQLDRLRAAIAVAEAQIARGQVIEWTPALQADIFLKAKEAAAMGKRPKSEVLPESAGNFDPSRCARR